MIIYDGGKILKKQIIIIIIIVFIFVFFTGCFENNSSSGNNISYFKKGELSLNITMDNNIYTVDSTEIFVKVILKNIASETKYISEYIHSNMKLFLIMNNETYIWTKKSVDYEKDNPIKINPNENIDYSFNLFAHTPFYDNESGKKMNPPFPQINEYSIYMNYKDIAISNILEFEIK